MIADVFLNEYFFEEDRLQRYLEEQERKIGIATEAAFLRLTDQVSSDDRIVISGNEVSFEGCVLRRIMVDQHHFWQVQGSCPICGIDVWSPLCDNKADIGRYIMDFVPSADDWHSCSKPPLVWRERLRLAWRTMKEGR